MFCFFCFFNHYYFLTYFLFKKEDMGWGCLTGVLGGRRQAVVALLAAAAVLAQSKALAWDWLALQGKVKVTFFFPSLCFFCFCFSVARVNYAFHCC